MQAETPKSFLSTCKGMFKYLVLSGYFWASIGFTIAEFVASDQWILENITLTLYIY